MNKKSVKKRIWIYLNPTRGLCIEPIMRLTSVGWDVPPCKNMYRTQGKGSETSAKESGEIVGFLRNVVLDLVSAWKTTAEPTQCLTLKTVQLEWNLVFFDEATRNRWLQQLKKRLTETYKSSR